MKKSHVCFFYIVLSRLTADRPFYIPDAWFKMGICCVTPKLSVMHSKQSVYIKIILLTIHYIAVLFAQLYDCYVDLMCLWSIADLQQQKIVRSMKRGRPLTANADFNSLTTIACSYVALFIILVACASTLQNRNSAYSFVWWIYVSSKCHVPEFLCRNFGHSTILVARSPTSGFLWNWCEPNKATQTRRSSHSWSSESFTCFIVLKCYRCNGETLAGVIPLTHHVTKIFMNVLLKGVGKGNTPKNLPRSSKTYWSSKLRFKLFDTENLSLSD